MNLSRLLLTELNKIKSTINICSFVNGIPVDRWMPPSNQLVSAIFGIINDDTVYFGNYGCTQIKYRTHTVNVTYVINK